MVLLTTLSFVQKPPGVSGHEKSREMSKHSLGTKLIQHQKLLNQCLNLHHSKLTSSSSMSTMIGMERGFSTISTAYLAWTVHQPCYGFNMYAWLVLKIAY